MHDVAIEFAAPSMGGWRPEASPGPPPASPPGSPAPYAPPGRRGSQGGAASGRPSSGGGAAPGAWNAALQPLRDAQRLKHGAAAGASQCMALHSLLVAALRRKAASPHSRMVCLTLRVRLHLSPPAPPAADVAHAALRSLGGAAAASAASDVAPAVLSVDLCLLCAALTPPAAGAAPPPSGGDLLVAVLDALTAAKGSTFPESAAPACAVFLATQCARSGGAGGDAAPQAVRALAALLAASAHAVPGADVQCIAAALQPFCTHTAARRRRSVGQAQASGDSIDGDALSGDTALLALSGLTSLLSVSAPIIPAATALAILGACGACLAAAVGPPGSSPGAPLPRTWGGDLGQGATLTPAAAKLAAAALKCATAACGHCVESGSAQPAAAVAAAVLPAPVVSALLAQSRRFMVFGIHDDVTDTGSAGNAAAAWASSGGESDSDADGPTPQAGSWRARRSSSSAAASGRPAHNDKAVRLRCAACALVGALARCSPKSVHPHWPALLHPRGGNVRDGTACIPALLATDPSPRVRAAAGHALCQLLEGPAARTFLQVAQAPAQPAPNNTASAAALSALLSDAAGATQRALCDRLRSEETLATLVVRCMSCIATQSVGLL